MNEELKTLERQENTSMELGELPEDLESIKLNPILKPLIDYKKSSELLEKEDKRESDELNEKTNELNSLMQEGIYSQSPIANAYKNILGIWLRIAWIYQKNTGLANKALGELKQMVDTYYISREEYDQTVSNLKAQVKELTITDPKKSPEQDTETEEEQVKRLREEIDEG